MQPQTQAAFQTFGLRLLFARCLADGSLEHWALQRPGLSAGILLCAYCVWLPFGALFSLLAHVLTTPGMLVLSLLAVVAGGRLLAHSMVFPASIPIAVHGMHREYAHRMRRDVARSIREESAALLTLATLQRRAAAGGGQDMPLSLPETIASALVVATQDASLASAMSSSSSPYSMASQPGAQGALTVAGLIHTLQAMGKEGEGEGDRAQIEGFGALSHHGALLLHYAIAARDLTRCIQGSIAAALRPAYTARDRAGVRAIASRCMGLPAIWVPQPGEGDASGAEDLLTGSHGLSPTSASALSHLHNLSPLAVLLGAHPPVPMPGETSMAVRQALAAGQGNGQPLTVKQALIAALSCYSRLQSLSAWMEVVPHDKVGLGRALWQVAGEAWPKAPVEEVEPCIHAASAAWWRAHLPGVVADRLGFPPSPALPPAPPALGGPPLGALLGIHDSTAVEAKGVLEAALAGAPIPIARDGLDDSSESGSPHPAAPPHMQVMQQQGQGQGQGNGAAGGAGPASPTAPISVPVTMAGSILRQAMSVLSTAADHVWHAATVSNCPSPVLGPEYLRAELRLRAAARQVWIASSGKHRVDALVVPSPATAAVWYPSPVPSRSAVGPVLLPVGLTTGSSNSRGTTEAADPNDPFAGLTMPVAAQSASSASTTAVASSPSPSSSSTPDISLHSPLIVILCAPNAGMYEHCLRHNDWVAVYGGGRIGSTTLPAVSPSPTATLPEYLGADVVLWNYRGVVRSRGRPTMRGLFQDVQAIVQWVKGKARQNARVIIHGESLGGIAACWAASAGLCDVAVSDRTFASLPLVAAKMLGVWADVGLRGLTGWSHSNTAAWMQRPSTPRVLLVDPNDSVIGWPVSLGSEVGLAVWCGEGKRASAGEGGQRTGAQKVADTVAAAGSSIVGAARSCFSSISRRASRLRDSGPDHASDGPIEGDRDRGMELDGEGEGNGVADHTALRVEEEPFDSATVPATFVSEFHCATAHLHYLLLHLSRVTAVVFARSNLRQGEEASLAGIPPEVLAQGLNRPGNNPAPDSPSTPDALPSSSSPCDRALVSMLKIRGADLPPTSAAFGCFVDECYGKIRGIWEDICASVCMSAVATCSKAQSLVQQAISQGRVSATQSGTGMDSAEFGGRMQAGMGCGALAAAMAGATNGLGQSLGECLGTALSSGWGPEDCLRETRSWVAAGLVWGWQAQAGQGPLAELAASLPRPPTYPPTPTTTTTPGLDLPCCAIANTPPYLDLAHETGLDTLQRRLLALKHAALAGVTGAPPAAASASTAPSSVLTVPADIALIDESLSVVARLHRLKGQWQALQAPQAATVAGALRSQAGLCVPLTCGHNAALTRREVQLVLKAVQAAAPVRT